MATLRDLSIIIPAYNATRFLPGMLDSLVNAGANDAREVIVVDDGSSDDTAAQAQRCVERLPRLRVHRQQNRGPGGARNAGLELAQGRYIHYVDADDALVTDAYRVFEPALAGDPALVEFDYWRENRQGRLRRKTSIPAHALEGGVANELAVMESGLVWTKLIRRDLAERVPFPEARLYEDDPVVGMLPLLATSIVKINRPLYIYRYQPQSITRAFTPRQLTDRRRMAETYRENCRRYGLDHRYPEAVEFRFFRMFAIGIWKAVLRSGASDRHAQAKAHSSHVRERFPDIERNRFFRQLSSRRRLGLRLLMSPTARFMRLAELLVARR